MTRMPRITAFLALLVVLGTGLAAVANDDTPVRVKVINSGRVYLPTGAADGRSWRKPATLVSRTIFDATPEWKTIVRRKLSPNTAEYCLLAKGASDRFKAAVTKASTHGGFDIVAETGAIKADNETLPDITSDVLANLALN